MQDIIKNILRYYATDTDVILHIIDFNELDPRFATAMYLYDMDGNIELPLQPHTYAGTKIEKLHH